jgi:hypothetical protein
MTFNAAALKQAASAPGFDEAPPDSLYETTFRDFDIFESKAGALTLRLSWTVASGQLRDHEWSSVQTLEELNARGEPNPALPITARIVETLGVDVDSVSRYEGPEALAELRTQLGKLTGETYEVEVKRNGQYVNTTPKRRLAGPQQSMSNGSTYGQPPAQQQRQQQPAQTSMGGGGGSAILQGDVPERSGLNLSTDDVRRDTERTGESDVPGAGPGDFEHSPPQKGDIDPETGEPIPF